MVIANCPTALANQTGSDTASQKGAPSGKLEDRRRTCLIGQLSY
jgi:hypothetical protein